MYSFKYGTDTDNNMYNSLMNQAYFDNAAQFNPLQQNFLNANAQLAPLFGLNGGMSANPLESMMPRAEKSINYYQEYCRLFAANITLTTQIKEMIEEKNEILQRISDLENTEKSSKPKPSSVEPVSDKKQRIRKKAADVERSCKCPASFCPKSYGSEGSLIQHIKLKHPELTEEPDWKMKILKTEGSGNDS